MASRKEKEDQKKSRKILNNPEIKRLRERIDSNSKDTTTAIYGADQSFIDRNRADLDQIRGTIKRVSDRYKQVTGEGIMEFLTKMMMEDSKGSAKGEITAEKVKEGMLNLNSVLESPHNGLVNEIFLKDKTRFALYDDYEALYEFIPQLAQAIDVFVDNTTSPDDFTKGIFSMFYNGETVTHYKTENTIINNLKNLERRYKVEGKAKDWLKKTMYLGDQFIATLSLDREFTKILGEDGELLGEETPVTILTEDTVVLSEEQEKLFDEYYMGALSESERAELGEDGTGVKWKEDIMKAINENVSFTDNKFAVIREELLMESDFSSMNVRDTFQSVSQTDISKSKQERAKEVQKKVSMTDGSLLMNEPRKEHAVKVSGSFLKALDPRRVVKIQLGDTCFGYYYIETDDDRYKFSTNHVSATAKFNLRTATDLRAGGDEFISDPKLRLIVDVFAKNISKKVNKKFIENNSEFKALIYELVKQDYIIKKRVQIVYLQPSEVEHLMPEEGPDGYGVSRFKRVLFTAKLYLSVLTSTLMLKLSRSADHRTFYIETGLSKDVEGIIQSFVREIKAKEIKLSDLKTIDSIFQNIGMFQDYFIPQTNGEKAIDIDTIPGQAAEIENDFLEYLKKTMISGMGIPASFLTYADEMEFARSVSMMNGMFLRTIIGFQKILGGSFSNIYRKLYKNEHQDLEDRDAEDESVVIDYEAIEVRFPPPSSLNMTNLNDQINNISGIADYITNIVAGAAGADAVRDKVARGIAKKYLPNVEWDYFENLLQDVSVDDVEEKLKKGGSSDDTDVEGDI